MNIPSGKQIISKLKVEEIDAKNMLNDLIVKQFNGYLAITIKERFGYEDAIIIFEKGNIVGCYYKLLNKGKEFYGIDALKLALNEFNAKYGTLDLFMLTKEQVDLMLTFNEKVKINAINDLNKIKDLFLDSYNPNLLGSTSSEENTSKYDLFKKIGLGNIGI